MNSRFYFFQILFKMMNERMINSVRLERRTLDRKVAGSILTRGAVFRGAVLCPKLSKTLHPNC